MSKPAPDTPESDVYEGAPHPRHAYGLVGHRAAEADMLAAYREGRLAHAWLIGGKEGVGKATLAWRFARFLLANPDPAARAVQEAQDLSVPPGHPTSRQLAAMAHPDFSLMRREWNPKSKGFYSELRVDDIRQGLQVFQLSAAFGGWRIAIVDCADDLNRESANALLKMIEEPPPRSLILIVAHRPGQVLPTIRSRCRRVLLEPLSAGEIETVLRGLGAPWSEAEDSALADAARRADGSVREALRRLDPDGRDMGALIDNAVRQLPGFEPRQLQRLSDALSGRAAQDGFEALHLALYDWLAARARASDQPARQEAIAALWTRLREAARETDALNLDRRLHVLAMFEEIASRAGRI